MQIFKYWIIILLVIIVLGLAFYWYSWRPARISKWCAQNTQQAYISEHDWVYAVEWERAYNACMRGAGVIK